MSKPKMNLFGEDGNIFAILGRASRLLRQNGQAKEAEEMYSRVTSSCSYEEALFIISEYVETELTPEADRQDQMKEELLQGQLLDIAKHHIYAVELRGDLNDRGSDSEDFISVPVGAVSRALRAAYDLGRGERQRERDSARKQKKRGQGHER